MNPFKSSARYFPPSIPLGNHTNIYGGSMTNVQGDQNIYHGPNVSTSHHHGSFNLHNGPLHRTTTYNVAGNLAINNGEAGIHDLFHASDPSASHCNIERDNPPRCHPETRKSILGSIFSWMEASIGEECKIVDEHGDERLVETKGLLWIHGPLGAGKSAIAQTISETYAKLGTLAASFFFSRGTVGRGTARHFISTLAFQIAMNISEARHAIGQAVEKDPSIFHQPLDNQARALILEPLKSIFATASSRFFLVVLDGLDECDSTVAQRQIVACAASLVKDCQIPLRFLISSRLEPTIQQAFRMIPYNYIPLNSTTQAHQDVETFLRSVFHDIRTSEKHGYYMDFYPEIWPSDEDIKVLVKRSGGFFIYAATVLRFVDEEYDEPQIRLQTIIDSSSSYSDAFKELDNLYRQILTLVPNTPLLLRILGHILLAKPPPPTYQQVFLTPRVIEIVLGLRPGSVLTTLRGMHSILRIGDNTQDAPIECQHASFPHFAFDKSRAQEFYIDSASCHLDIARGCLTFIASPTATMVPADPTRPVRDPRPVIHYILNTWTFHLQRAVDPKSLYDHLQAINDAQWAEVMLRWYSADSRGYWECFDMLEDAIDLLETRFRTTPTAMMLISQFASVRCTAYRAHLRHLQSKASYQSAWISCLLHTVSLFDTTGFLLSLHKGGALSTLLGLQVPVQDDAWYDIRKYMSFLQTGRSGKAFAAFMNDPQQSEEFFVEPETRHAHLADRCMSLRPLNVIRNTDVRDREAYLYAAKYWAKHLFLSTTGGHSVLKQLESIEPKRFLFGPSLTTVIAEMEVSQTSWKPYPNLYSISTATSIASYPRHLLSLLRSMVPHNDLRNNIWRLVFEIDTANIKRVIAWLQNMPGPPVNVLSQWNLALHKYDCMTTQLGSLEGSIDYNVLWESLKTQWGPRTPVPTPLAIAQVANVQLTPPRLRHPSSDTVHRQPAPRAPEMLEQVLGVQVALRHQSHTTGQSRRAAVLRERLELVQGVQARFPPHRNYQKEQHPP